MKEKVFGHLAPLSMDQYKEFYRATGENWLIWWKCSNRKRMFCSKAMSGLSV